METNRDDILGYEESGESLSHYGMPRRSGRYPWGSGKDPYQRGGKGATYNSRFISMYEQGVDLETIAKTLGKPKNDIQWYDLTRAIDADDKAIYKAFDISSREFRNHYSNGKNLRRIEDANQVRWYRSKEGGYKTPTEISRIMGINESSVRNLMNEKIALNTVKTQKAADEIKEFLETHKYVDVGAGTEIAMGISADRLEKAIGILENEGYKRHKIKIDQMGTTYQTTFRVLTKGDVTWKEVLDHRNDISFMKSQFIRDPDGTIHPNAPVQNISDKRILIRYAEEGGLDKDGLIEIRRGVPDLDLGNAKYAQVRIGVNGTHYLKGMAVSSDDIPPGYDIVFNTNKKLGTPMLGKGDKTVLKEQKAGDPGNPFGASLKTEDQLKMVQHYYIDKDGNKKVSAINVVNEEGTWSAWKKSLPSQFLSKQPIQLAKEQLNAAKLDRRTEFEDIMALTNNTVKRKRLADFAETCDADAVDLQAHAMPHQSTHVILPVPSMKETECFAPRYENGTSVVLVRFPHGGQFEIPRLTVNNKNKEAIDMIGKQSIDAIGINAKTAKQLSGADFDGDTVLVIPDNHGRVRTKAMLEGLKDFDPDILYGDAPEGTYIKKKGSKQEQTEMGVVSNLITDMSLANASTEELTRAVKHSMVVIDSAKHRLNIKQSFKDNNIQELMDRYQPKDDPTKKGGGASTIVSKAGSQEKVNDRVRRMGINASNTDPVTGEKIWKYKEPWKYEEDGTPVYRHVESTKMYEAKDARDLISPNKWPMEYVYADYANSMKALANEARVAYFQTPRSKYDPAAAKEYKEEVDDLKRQLKVAESNSPREREAQVVAHQIYDARLAAAGEVDKEHAKKMRGKALNDARELVGAHKQRVQISDRQWEAIQKGAVSDSALTKILANADPERVKKLSTPKGGTPLTPSKKALIEALASRGSGEDGYTLNEIAEQVGVSPATVGRYLNGESD